jgi:transposase
MWKPTEALPMSLEQKRTLEAWVRARNTPQTVALRARICLLASDGMSNNAIAKKLETSRPTVLLWRKRFKEQGILGLSEEATKGPSKRRLSRSKVDEIVQATLHTKPAGATHWSVRTMAKAQGVSPITVARIWQAHGLKPHRTKTFKTEPNLACP